MASNAHEKHIKELLKMADEAGTELVKKLYECPQLFYDTDFIQTRLRTLVLTASTAGFDRAVAIVKESS